MGRVIGLKAGTIEGDVSVTGVEKNIRVDSVSVGASAQITYDSSGGGHVQIGDVSLLIKYGEWVAELQKACFDGLIFETVTIIEVDQKNEAQGSAEAKLVRTIKLTNAYISNIGLGWDGPYATCSLSFAFEKWDLTYEAKSGAKMASRDLMATT
ncbi:MAG: type VI secretion system tube protein Hcp [Labilithrix sp.]|nr:type VI secretion system tube protein Hcp [Labilithrix sp.]MCW5811442.1 type VI secretion system tube protein Hcp [Labilithrix sp.]